MTAVKVHPGAALVVALALVGMVGLGSVLLARDDTPSVVALGGALLALLALLAYFAERRIRGG